MEYLFVLQELAIPKYGNGFLCPKFSEFTTLMWANVVIKINCRLRVHYHVPFSQRRTTIAVALLWGANIHHITSSGNVNGKPDIYSNGKAEGLVRSRKRNFRPNYNYINQQVHSLPYCEFDECNLTYGCPAALV